MKININLFTIFIVLLVLKLTYLTGLSWVIVTAPLWVPLGILIILGGLTLLLLLLKLMYFK